MVLLMIYNLELSFKLSILMIQDIKSCHMESRRNILPKFYFCVDEHLMYFLTNMIDLSIWYNLR